MSEYNPDKWLVVKVNSDQPHYRVFGSWYGGFAKGDSWKMNSGITKIREEGACYHFEGSSGSVYVCHKSNYGSHMYGSGVLQNIIENSAKENVQIEILSEDTNFMELSYE